MTLPHPGPPPQSSFFGDVLTLVTGTFLAQVITILSTPVITRLYGPEAFGLLAIFIAITSILSVIVCLRYEFAIMLPKSDTEAANVFGLCMLLLILMSMLTIPFLILFQNSIEHLVKDPQIGNYFWLIPASIVLSGTFQALNYWNTRSKQFHRLAITQVIRSCSTNGTQLGAGFIGYASGGILIGATLIGQLVSTLTLGIQIMREYLAFFKQNITWKGMAYATKKYSNFPKYDIWSALINTISGTLPVFFLTIYFTPATVGFYALGMMVLQLPLGLIGSAIAQVFFQKAAEAKNISQKLLSETVEKTLKPLIFFAFFPSVLLILIGPEIFGAVFGIRWEESGIYVRYLALWIGMVFISSPISTLYSIFQKQNFSLFFNILQMISWIIALFIGAAMGDALLSIILFGVIGFTLNIFSFIYLLRLSDVPLSYPPKIFITYLMFSVPFILAIILFQRLVSSNIYSIVIFSSVMAILYYVILIKKDPEILNALKNMNVKIPLIMK